MRGLYLSLLIVAIAIIICVNGASLQGPKSECPDICTFDYRPICGYDGKCYNVYGNECNLKSDRCKNKRALKTVEMDLCDEALARSNPQVVSCAVE